MTTATDTKPTLFRVMRELNDLAARVTDRPDTVLWLDTIREALPVAPSYGFKTWFHNLPFASGVETLQINLSTGGAWAPGPRTILNRSTYVLLDESRRDFRGMHVIVSNADIMVAHDADMDTLVVYRVVK